MQKFSKIIESQNSFKPFGFTANLVVKGVVYAENEGDAGYQIDSKLEAIEGVETTDLVDIFEVNEETAQESVLESVSAPAHKLNNIGPAVYARPSTGHFDIWTMQLREGAVEVEVPTYLKLDRNAPYVLRVPKGEKIASPFDVSNLLVK